MEMKPVILRAEGGNPEEVAPANGRRFTLDELQKIVGGYIEVVPTNDGRVMVLDEEGKLKGKRFNESATEILAGADIVVGDALVAPRAFIR